MVEGNHWDQWFFNGFGVRKPLVMMVFDGFAPLVRRWNGYVPSSKSIHRHISPPQASKTPELLATTTTNISTTATKLGNKNIHSWKSFKQPFTPTPRFAEYVCRFFYLEMGGLLKLQNLRDWLTFASSHGQCFSMCWKVSQKDL